MLFQSLRQTEVSKRRYILKAWLWTTPIAFAINLHIGVLLELADLGGMATPDFPQQFEAQEAAALVVLAVVIAPVVETLLMGPILWIIGKFVRSDARRALTSAAIWGLLHVFNAPLYGLFTFWPFFVWSLAYIHLRRRSWFRTVFIVACVHALHNAMALGLLLFVMSAPPPTPVHLQEPPYSTTISRASEHCPTVLSQHSRRAGQSRGIVIARTQQGTKDPLFARQALETRTIAWKCAIARAASGEIRNGSREQDRQAPPLAACQPTWHGLWNGHQRTRHQQ